MSSSAPGNPDDGAKVRAGLLARVRRVVVAVIGTTIVLIGVAMIVLPGPAFIVIPLGLGILATEFLWARRLLQRVKDRIASTRR